MASLITGYEYDIFISYRQKDNKGDRWVSEFVEALKTELESTFKEDISVYFDINPDGGILETHDVDASLKEKLKCLVFIPVLSRTYCDVKSFAWEHEFKAFVDQASRDQFGLKVKLPGGNVASRVLPVIIHDLDITDIKEYESITGGVLRGVEFIYKTVGVNRPLRSHEDKPGDNQNRTFYRDQINKVALTIKDIIAGLKGKQTESGKGNGEIYTINEKSAVPEKSIIVLPFENMSSDPEQEYFSDGLTEEIITDLSHIHDLLVISRTSAMTFKGTKKRTGDIAREVNVKYVLEGSVRKAGNNLRITAQLIDAAYDVHLWAEKYSGSLDDVFEIQEKVSRSIADALKLKLSPEEKKKLAERTIDNVQAYEYYLMAYREIWKYSEEGLKAARQYLEDGIGVTGDNPYIYAALANVYWHYANLITNKDDYYEKAEIYARKALTFDPNFPKAHTALGFVDYLSMTKLKESAAHFKRALAVNPNEFEALHGLAILFAFAGQSQEALSLTDKMLKLDPLNPVSHLIKGAVLFYNGQFDMANDRFSRAYVMDPGNRATQFYYASNLALIGKTGEAIAIIDRSAEKTTGNPFTKTALMLKYGLLKDKENAFKELTPDYYKYMRGDGYAYFIAVTMAMLDEKEKALDWLESATDHQFHVYPFIMKHDPLIENIRSEDGFKSMMERLKYKWENFEI
ncbi:MAG: hypothetical protein U9N72_03790 [Bacteroidota bacterium]|nr:hypothetical protein [Bacteroidota bacterium]